jgi:L-ascorbate metabolism protein UlaG (beta-lactamase superfamily)
MKIGVIFLVLAIMLFFGETAAAGFEKDVIDTSEGKLTITFIGHGTLMFEGNDLVVHVDPWSRLADYDKLPDADIILVTHNHGDHLDKEAIAKIRKDDTSIIASPVCSDVLTDARIMKNGDAVTVKGLKIKATPAYNIVHMRSEDTPYHPRGEGNGYVVGFGDKRVYIAGDTENIPEMKELEEIDVAFLPMNLPYTMTPEMATSAAESFKPGILYPYHFGDADTSRLVSLLKDNPEIEVRIRDMK